MEGAELQDGAARAGAHDASGDADAGPGTTQLTPPQPARLGPQPPPRLQSAEEICNIVLALGVKAAAEEGAAQGGSAGGGSQEATGAQGEEGVIARGTHLATSNMHVDGDQVACNLQSVGSVRSNAAKGKASKETVSITEMARRVKMWGITKPQNAKHSVWKWGFKYAHPTIAQWSGPMVSYPREAWQGQFALGAGNSFAARSPKRIRSDVANGAAAQDASAGLEDQSSQAGSRQPSARCTRSCQLSEVIAGRPLRWCRVRPGSCASARTCVCGSYGLARQEGESTPLNSHTTCVFT
jgi:hypothetical protein